MVHPDLLEILVCPETKQRVRAADGELIARLNEAIRAGSVRNREGREVGEPIGAGLVREDGRVLYPVHDDIPIMLLDEAIPLEGLA